MPQARLSPRDRSQRVWQNLKDDVPIAGSVAVRAQRGQAKGMCSVVGEIETSFRRDPVHRGVAEPCAARAQQAFELLAVRRLPCQRLAGPQRLSSREVTLVTDQSDLRLRHHADKETDAFPGAPNELLVPTWRFGCNWRLAECPAQRQLVLFS